jgi:hypothetical protein
MKHLAQAGYLGPKARDEALADVEKAKDAQSHGDTAEVLQRQHHGAVTGRWSGKSGFRTHTVYPKRVMLAVGTLGQGLDFYGPFDDGIIAMRWAADNLTTGADVRLETIHIVRSDKG